MDQANNFTVSRRFLRQILDLLCRFEEEIDYQLGRDLDANERNLWLRDSDDVQPVIEVLENILEEEK